jgi:hypothetical protein
MKNGSGGNSIQHHSKKQQNKQIKVSRRDFLDTTKRLNRIVRAFCRVPLLIKGHPYRELATLAGQGIENGIHTHQMQKEKTTEKQTCRSNRNNHFPRSALPGMNR